MPRETLRRFKLQDGSVELDEFAVQSNIAYSWSVGNANPLNLLDKAVDKMPSYVSISFGVEGSYGASAGKEDSYVLILKGKDVGLHRVSSMNWGVTAAAGVEGKYSVGAGWYMGEDEEMESAFLAGRQVGLGAGVQAKIGPGGGVAANLTFGLGDKGQFQTTELRLTLSGGFGIAPPVQPSLSVGEGDEAQTLFSLPRWMNLE